MDEQTQLNFDQLAVYINQSKKTVEALDQAYIVLQQLPALKQYLKELQESVAAAKSELSNLHSMIAGLDIEYKQHVGKYDQLKASLAADINSIVVERDKCFKERAQLATDLLAAKDRATQELKMHLLDIDKAVADKEQVAHDKLAKLSSQLREANDRLAAAQDAYNQFKSSLPS